MTNFRPKIMSKNNEQDDMKRLMFFDCQNINQIFFLSLDQKVGQIVADFVIKFNIFTTTNKTSENKNLFSKNAVFEIRIQLLLEKPKQGYLFNFLY